MLKSRKCKLHFYKDITPARYTHTLQITKAKSQFKVGLLEHLLESVVTTHFFIKLYIDDLISAESSGTSEDSALIIFCK